MVRPIDTIFNVDLNEGQNTETQNQQNIVAQNDGSGGDSLRGALFFQESVFKFRFAPPGTPPVATQAIDHQKVDTTVKLIKNKLDESGWFNDVTHGELEDIENSINNLTPEEATAVFNGLSDGDLHKWVNELGSGAWFGYGGYDGGEKTRLFDTLAGKLDGDNLNRFASNLEGDDLRKFGQAIAAHGTDAAKEAFIKAAAARSETDPHTALAVAEVLASMKGNPDALQRTLGALTQGQIDKIVQGATQKEQYTSNTFSPYGPSTPVTTIIYDAAPLGKLLDAVSSVNDPAIKARLFEPAARQLKEIEDAGGVVSSLGGFVYLKNDSVNQIRNGLSEVINGDTTGVVGALETSADSYTGTGLTAYLKSMLNNGQEKQVGEMVSRMLLGNDLKGNAVDRFRTQSPGNAGDSLYDNAENLGYFLGSIRAAAKQITDDTGKQADFVKNIFGAALGAAGLPGAASAGIGWLSGELINRVADGIKEGKTNIYNGLIQLGLPRVNSNTIYDGPAEEAFKSGFSFVVDNG